MSIDFNEWALHNWNNGIKLSIPTSLSKNLKKQNQVKTLNVLQKDDNGRQNKKGSPTEKKSNSLRIIRALTVRTNLPF
uniref:Uncharacterized protein n=1 Tax=Rhizophagus irregularis (strain DAOM 181602 / DAOM 197198 / MUCL 43194) TaxID=747089 RepID=U9TP21_RHIID